MSHYKPYPAYKDSGLEWLGQVPEHWRFELLTNVSRFQSGKAHEPFIDDDGDFICVNSRFVSTGGLSQKFCTQNLSPACVDDILMVMSDLPNGRALAKAFYSDRDEIYAVNQRVCIISPIACSPRFLFYLLDRNCHFLSQDDGINQTHLPNSAFTKFRFYLPPSSEQQAIALVLDRETARIDALIEKKTRFVELLREKRQALITHAVTKGLDPSVKMKNSGVEWLGEVPEHWELLPLKRLISSIGQGWSPECEARIPEEGEWGVVKVGCVNGGVFRPEESKALPAEMEPRPELSLRAGDVLISRANTRELVGSCAVVPHDYPYLMLCDKLYRVGCGERVTPDFLAALVTVYGRRAVEIEATGASSSMVNIAQSVILDLFVAAPGTDEQVEIISWVSAATARIERLREQTERSIFLLKERRVALITASVTGQIDLREAV